MLREIKFRAWQLPNEDLDRTAKMIYDDNDMSSPGYHIGHFGAFEDKGFIFMQYTGLKDKNGREIYESDILKVEPMGSPNPWDGLLFIENLTPSGFWMVHTSMKPWGEPLKISAGVWETYSKEIVGNIHENPELLKET